MANIREVARLAGVSSGTVSRYLNGIKIRDKNAKAIAKVIDELNYRPSILGRALTNSKSYTVGVLLVNAGNVFVGSCISTLETEFEKRGYSALFVDFHGSLDVLWEKIEYLRSRSVDGLVIFLSETDETHMKPLATLDIPVIVIDNPLSDDTVDSIVVNNMESTEHVVGAMIDAGHRRIGIIAPSQKTYVGRQRLEGWKRAYAARNLPICKNDIILCDSTKNEGFEAACRFLDCKDVTAIFASNYYMALGALKAMNERGVRPGVDLGFGSFDDYDFSDVIYPPLTVIGQPMQEIVDTVVRTMCARLDEGARPSGVRMLTCEVCLTDSIMGGLRG